MTDEEKDRAVVFMLDTVQRMGPTYKWMALKIADEMRRPVVAVKKPKPRAVEAGKKEG